MRIRDAEKVWVATPTILKNTLKSGRLQMQSLLLACCNCESVRVVPVRMPQALFSAVVVHMSAFDLLMTAGFSV